MSLVSLQRRSRAISMYGVSYPEQNIQQLVAYFHLKVNNDTPDLKKRQRCFKAVLNVCLEGPVDRIRQISPFIPDLKDKNKQTIFEAFLDQTSEVRLQMVLDTGLHEVMDPNQSNEALHICLRQGRRMMIPQLARYMNINQIDRYGRTPVHIAVERDDFQALKQLIALDQRPLLGIPVQLDKTKCYLLSWSVVCGAARCFEWLADQRELTMNEYVEGVGHLPHVAIHCGQYDMLQLIMKRDPSQSLLEVKDNIGRTPLSKAAARGEARSVALLLRLGAKIESVDDKNMTALHWAAQEGHRQVVELLIYRGADPRCVSIDGKLPHQLAKNSGLQNFLLSMTHGTVARSHAPQEKVTRPWQLVFQGGGPAGIGHLGAIRYLERHHFMIEVTDVVGTSAGAITAGLLSIGYTSDEMETILKAKSLMDFIDHPFKFEKIVDHIKQNNSIGGLFNVFRKASNLVSHGFNLAACNPVPLIVGTLSKLWHCTGVCDGEAFRLWIEDLNLKKTGIRYYTLGDHADRISAGYPYKHIHLFVTKLSRHGKEEIVHFSSADPKCRGYILSDLERCSMSIPGVFKPHNTYVRNEKGERDIFNPDESLVDGGMLCNLGITALDFDAYGRSVFNTHTLGFALTRSAAPLQEGDEEKIETVGQLMKSIARTYSDAEILIRRLNPNNNLRIVEIDKGDETALSFDMDAKRMDKLIRSGERAASQFFDDALDTRSCWMHSLDLTQNMQALTCNIPPILGHFVGRGEALEALRKFCGQGFTANWRASEAVRSLTIMGEAGVGKSELAFHFVLEQVGRFSLAFWLDGSNQQTLLASFTQLAKILQVPLTSPTDLQQVSQQVARKLESGQSAKPWILVVDNQAEEVVWESPRTGGFILHTSRNSLPNPTTIALSGLTKEEALRLLDHYHLSGTKADREMLIENLGYNPLAIVKAAAYIQEEDLSIPDYLKALEDPSLFSQAASPIARTPLLCAVQLALNGIQKKLPMAWQFLSNQSHLLPSVLSHDTVLTWLENSQKVRAAVLPKTVNDIISILKRYRILRHDAEKKELIIHPVVKMILRPARALVAKALPVVPSASRSPAPPASPQNAPHSPPTSPKPAAPKNAPVVNLQQRLQEKGLFDLVLTNSSVDNGMLETMLKNSPQLQILDISNCPQLSDSCLRSIERLCPSLQTLKMNRQNFKEIDVSLKDLRYLEMQDCTTRRLQIFTQNPNITISGTVRDGSRALSISQSILLKDNNSWIIVCSDNSNWKSKTLHHMILSNDTKGIKKLRDEQTNFEVRDLAGATALHLYLHQTAPREGVKQIPVGQRTKMIRILLERTNPNLPLPVTHPDYPLQSPIHMLVQNKETAPQIWDLFKNKGTDFNQIHIGNLTPLHRICETGNLAQIKILLAIDGVEVNASSPRGITPLHIAAGRGYLHLVDELLRKGATLEPLSYERETPFMSACIGNSVSVAEKLLVRGAKLNHQNSQGMSALHLICQFNNVTDVLNLLVHKGIELNLTDNLGRTALHICAEKGRSALATQLLQAGIDRNIRDRQGRTALEIARQKGHEATIAALSSS